MGQHLDRRDRRDSVGWGEPANPNTHLIRYAFRMRYRRARVPGATYFFTVNLADRRSRLLVENIDVLRATLRRVQQAHPFHMDAMVVLPDHLHAMWTLPADDADFSMRWMLIKAGFSRQMATGRSASRIAKSERGLWQRRFWEHLIRDTRDYERHFGYIHFNPVKHGLTQAAVGWPYSSIHRYIRLGTLERDWTADKCDEDEFGE